MDAKSWVKTQKAIRKSKKTYAHFDYRIDIDKKADYILNPQNIVSHGFYPFIHYKKVMPKFNGKKVTHKKEIFAMPLISTDVYINIIVSC